MTKLFYIFKNYGAIAAIPVAAAAVALYAAIRIIYLKASHRQRTEMSAEISRGLLVWYLMTLIILVWFPELPRLFIGKISFEEFANRTFKLGRYAFNMRFFSLIRGNLSILRDKEFVGNIILFVPYGILLTIAFRKLRWWAVGLIGLGTTMLIEVVQPLLGRSCDLDDVIANTFGTLIGCAAVKLTLKAVSAAKK